MSGVKIGIDENDKHCRIRDLRIIRNLKNERDSLLIYVLETKKRLQMVLNLIIIKEFKNVG